MNTLPLLFSQQGTANPVLVWDTIPAPAITCTRNDAGVYVFGGTDIPDHDKCRLFVSPLECEHQGTGEPVLASVSTQGVLKVLGRDMAGALSDFNMADGVSIPMILYVYP